MHDSLVRGTVVTSTEVIPDGWIAITGERIAAVGGGPRPASGHGAGLLGQAGAARPRRWAYAHQLRHRLPGIEGATRSAAAGGVTTCVDMPYDVPQAVTDAGVLAEKIGWVNRTAHVDVALYGTIAKHGGVDAVAGLAAGGVCSFKLSTYEYDPVRFPRIDRPTMIEAFAAIARTGLPVSVHNEDQELAERLTADARAAGQTEAIMHCRTRPPLAETLADNEIFEIGLARARMSTSPTPPSPAVSPSPGRSAPRAGRRPGRPASSTCA